MARGRAHIGMAGWVYPEWRGGFYPVGTTHKSELAYASRHVTSIEVNGSFYSLQKPASWQSWRDATPDDFVFSVKAPRFITHIRRLRNVQEPLERFFASGVLSLGSKLGAIMWQLPADLSFDPAVLDTFLGELPKTAGDRRLRHALEVRNPSFDNPEMVDLCREHGIAVVFGDSGGKWPVIDSPTAEFRYARLHADTAIYPAGHHEPADLDRWAGKIAGWLDSGQDAYIYFDNDSKVRAPIDAMSLIERFAGA